MKKIYVALLTATVLLVGSTMKVSGQNTFPATGSAGIGTTTPTASALLDMVSTSKGLLAPRMNKTQRDAIATPATGLLIYQTNSTPGFYYYNGTGWLPLAAAGGANKFLSNLTSPVAVNQNLTPSADKLRDLGSKTLRWDEAFAANVIATDNDQTAAIGSFINTRVDTVIDPTALFAQADTTAFAPATSGAPWGIGLDAQGGFLGVSAIGWGLGGLGVQGIGDIGVYGAPFDTTFLAGWGGYFDGHVVALDYWIFSDRKLKSNIKTMDNSLDKLMQLKPSTYNYKSGGGFMFDKKMHYGLIADEVEAIFPEMVREAKSAIKRNPYTGEKTPASTFKSVNYTALIPVLISSVQEQQAEIEAKDATIADLEERINRLEAAFNDASSDVRTNSGSSYNGIASLDQNSPNPFKDKTVISYNVPETAGNAVIKIFSLTGEEMKSVSLTGKGKGTVEINGGSFQAGTYTYQLIVDGKSIDTKIMVLTK
ncbi:MAG: tail fiber domain-containing protein [Fimbriimonadaceae bacterium]|nr:tail fiber domain-containing protein [Chitinophagales bacterium]